MTNPVAVRSSSLAHVAYDSRRDILQVTFRDGTVYQYDSVPLGTYHALLQAESKGAYFNRYIRNLFPHEAIRADRADVSGRSQGLLLHPLHP
jgi:hypothetical protein